MTIFASTPSSLDVDIQQFLAAEGFLSRQDTLRARALLEAAGLTRPGKRRIASIKLERAREILSHNLIRVCHRKACRDIVDGRERVLVPTALCELCGGSPNRRAGRLAAQALVAAGYRRLLILGGNRSTFEALVESLGSNVLELRWVDGTQGTRGSSTVDADLDWADFMVVWATTPLPHKVSRPYTTRAPGRVPLITVARRGVEAMCDALNRSLYSGRLRGTQAAVTSVSDRAPDRSATRTRSYRLDESRTLR